MEYGNGKRNQLVWEDDSNRYHNEEFDVKPENQNVNVAILSRYISSEDRILDIGCGEGKLGAVLCGRAGEIYGVDLDNDAREYAKKKHGYKEVYSFNVERAVGNSEYETLRDGKNPFTVIALVDILEHLLNPTDAINNIIPLIADGGKILVSVPNVNNADIFLNMLRDKFNYQQSGVLDNTHAKYFTKRSFLEWIDQINQKHEFLLDCEYVGATYSYTDFMDEVKRDFPGVYAFVQKNPYFHVMQHLFVLTVYKDAATHKAEKLEALLDQTGENLIPVLERAIACKIAEQPSAAEELSKISILPNERDLMQAEIDSANAGWQACSKALEEDAKEVQESNAGWEKCQAALDKESDKCQELQAGWTACNQALEQANANVARREQSIAAQQEYIAKLEHDIAELKEYVNKLEADNAALQEKV